MPCYSVRPGDWIFVKSYRLCFFAKDMSKHSQTLLDHAKQSATDALKTTSKRAIQKTAGTQLVIWLAIKFMIKLQKSWELNKRIVWRQLKMKQKIWNLIEKYLKKDIYLQKNDKIIDDLWLI